MLDAIRSVSQNLTCDPTAVGPSLNRMGPMSHREVAITMRLCSRLLQHSQACGTLQLGPSSWSSQFHTAALQATVQQQSAQKRAQVTHGSVLEGLRSALWPAQRQAWRTAGFATSSRQHSSEADLRVVQAEMPELEYHKLADHTLEHLQERLEVFVEDMDIDGGDVEHAQGVLTVKLGSHGTYVINKQTPNRQIWLSSPLSGPFRFDYHEGSWVYRRDGRELLSQLQQEMQELLGQAPHLTD